MDVGLNINIKGKHLDIFKSIKFSIVRKSAQSNMNFKDSSTI